LFVSKKRWIALTKRIADLEVQVQSQQEFDVKVNSEEMARNIAKGTCTINQARTKHKLTPLSDAIADKPLIIK
jgi:hypothetical protein